MTNAQALHLANCRLELLRDAIFDLQVRLRDNKITAQDAAADVYLMQHGTLASIHEELKSAAAREAIAGGAR